MRKGKLFYRIYFTFIILFFIGMALVLYWLNGWLKAYEASRPTAKCNEVIAELFTNPDWGNIYDLSGTEDTVFENRNHYIAYMTDKVGNAELTCSETSAGLSGNKKYFMKLGDEKLISFTLICNESPENGITEWSLGEISLLLNREQSVRILKEQGHTGYINGTPLGEEYTEQRISILAENYLPEGVQGPRYEQQLADNLLMPPEVSITDEAGRELEVIYDSERAVYTERSEAPAMSDEEGEAALQIAEGYCKYMINAADNLSSFFDSDTTIYKTIKRNISWMQDYSDYQFIDESVSDYYRYTDDLFSARVTLSLNVTRNNGTIKEYDLDSCFLFEKQESGEYLAIEMTNIDMLQPVSEVRLIFRDSDGIQTLQDDFISAHSRKLTTPSLTIPEGQSLAGWAREMTDENGSITRVLMFIPDEKGEVDLPDGYVLEPMILYPILEDINREDKGE